jgi:hypothetical protein
VASDTWRPIAPAPTARYQHSVVTTGSEMIVWGGLTNAFMSGDPTGDRYDLRTDTWRPMSSVAAPPGRRFANFAIWTGSQMLIWAGDGQRNGRYDPVMDSWSAMSNVGQPQARPFHSAVWTGSEMIVWGGGSSAARNDGGRYNPGLDRWLPTSTVGAPAARGRHSAVWTGSEMIIWGGEGEGASPAILADGARYAPGLDTWREMSTMSAPACRDHHALWTGSLMLILGGDGPSGPGPFGRYDPVGDTWSSLGDVGRPYVGVAVWTGTEVLMWHADSVSGRYDPVGDAWRPMATAGSPPNNGNYRAVWTGTDLILWGAVIAAPITDALGGRYRP